MLELVFSALITILPDYLYRSRVQGKEINALFFLVRVTLGHHGLRGAGDYADYSYLLLPSSDFERHLTV